MHLIGVGSGSEPTSGCSMWVLNCYCPPLRKTNSGQNSLRQSTIQKKMHPGFPDPHPTPPGAFLARWNLEGSSEGNKWEGGADKRCQQPERQVKRGASTVTRQPTSRLPPPVLLGLESFPQAPPFFPSNSWWHQLLLPFQLSHCCHQAYSEGSLELPPRSPVGAR